MEGTVPLSKQVAPSFSREGQLRSRKWAEKEKGFWTAKLFLDHLKAFIVTERYDIIAQRSDKGSQLRTFNDQEMVTLGMLSLGRQRCTWGLLGRFQCQKIPTQKRIQRLPVKQRPRGGQTAEVSLWYRAEENAGHWYLQPKNRGTSQPQTRTWPLHVERKSSLV